MKNILAFILLISPFIHAQYTINGTMNPATESEWVILYKIEGTKQLFIQNSEIKITETTVQGEKQKLGNFNFTMPKDSKTGSYRITYSLNNKGYVDFIFNREDVRFNFHPDFPNESVTFLTSRENILYRKYVDEISKEQEVLDSIQVRVLQNPGLNLKIAYTSSLNKINTVQEKYIKVTREMYILPFIEASSRKNPSEIIATPQKYMSYMVDTFFDNIDFNNKTLLNSSFLIDRITDYVFYINYSDDTATQQKLLKESIDKVLSKVENNFFKKEVIQFLITQFEGSMNLELIDYLFGNHYNALPLHVQDKKFKEEKMGLFATEVGRNAPNFSWIEKGERQSLSKLNEGLYYVLLFWSTECSHCLREIPQLHEFLKENKKIIVIAFSLEKNDFSWKNYKKKLPNWHHVLGLKKWQNKIVNTYNINATPTYFVLDSTKKIIGKPNELKELKSFIKKL